MFSTIVVADDLTGANATGVLLNEIGQETLSILSDVEAINLVELSKNYESICFSTNSRNIPKEEAYKKIYELVTHLSLDKDALFNKRIDSTLRGNVGSEIDAMADALGEDCIAYVVPAYPSSGRQCLGGYCMVDGLILEKTFAALDPKSPVRHSCVADIIAEQSDRKIAEINIDIVNKSSEEIQLQIKKEISDGAKIIVFDAMSEQDIERIAKAVTFVENSFFTVCPGPFVKEVARRMNYKKRDKSKILLTLGSVTEQTVMQIRHLMNRKLVFFHRVDVERLIKGEDDDSFVLENTKIIQDDARDYTYICVSTTDLNDDFRLDLEMESKALSCTVEELSGRINRVLAKITKNLIDSSLGIKGILSSGGDTTVAIAEHFGFSALHIKGEVLPLAVFGTLEKAGGEKLEIVTKGGMIGGENAMVKIVNYLEKNIK